MCLWPERDYTSAVRTAVTLQKQGGSESVKQPGYISMTPQLIMIAARTGIRAGPQIFFPLLINMLENYFDE